MKTEKLSKIFSELSEKIIKWGKEVQFKDLLPDLVFFQEITRKFTRAIIILTLLMPIFYFSAFHGKCTSRISVGPGGSGYRYLNLQEQFFFNLVVTKKAWWELADNSKNFDSTSFNEGHVTRWRGFGYLWKWEESYDVVYQ